MKALQTLSGSHAFNEDLTHSLKVRGRWRTSALNNLDFTLSASLLYNLNLTSWMERFRSPTPPSLGSVRTVTFTVVFLSLLCSFVSPCWKPCSSVGTSPRALLLRGAGLSQVWEPFVWFQIDSFLWRAALDGTWLFSLGLRRCHLWVGASAEGFDTTCARLLPRGRLLLLLDRRRRRWDSKEGPWDAGGTPA